MKKYVLIKKYPGSPKLNSIIEQSPNNWWGIKHDGNCFSGCNAPDDPKDYPEFWEEVVEKDFEMLSFFFNGGIFKKTGEKQKHYLTGENHNVFRANGKVGLILEEPDSKYNENFYIYSVKRLSDGEVFTVGDNIKNTNFLHLCGKITSLTLRDDTIVVKYNGGRDLLRHISHNKQPKFKSEDGVNLNYDDDCYIVHKPLDNKTTLTYSKFRKELLPIPSYRLIFSSKEAAEKYIDLNKPAYSKAQLLLWLINPKEAIKELLNK